MRRLLPVALVCALAAPAAADGVYFSESFGGTNVKDELGEKMNDALRVRVAIGIRRKQWAIEGWFAGDLGMGRQGFEDKPLPPSCPSPRCMNDPADRPHDASLLTYGIDVKYLKPISKNLEVYLRGSISHGILDRDNMGGRGLGAGAGIQLKGKVPAAGLLFWPLFFTNWGPKMTAAVFIDDGFDFYRLHEGGDLDRVPAIDAQLSHLTIGFAAGTDF